MEAVDLKDELTCFICKSIFKDPVSLRCGHKFCRECVDRLLGEQDSTRNYKCPHCNEKFSERPSPQGNVTLSSIAERLLSTNQEQKEVEEVIICDYCFHSSVAAIKSCLLCEASLCENHLRLHSKAPEHILCNPTSSPKIKKCPIHNEIFKYYCSKDNDCMSCSLVGNHKGHELELLPDAAYNMKTELQDIQENLSKIKNEAEDKLKILQDRKTKLPERAAEIKKRQTDIIQNNRNQLDLLQIQVLSETSCQEEKASLSLSDKIHQLEEDRDDLSTEMSNIKEICVITDPLTVLQEGASHFQTEDTKDEDSTNTDIHSVANLAPTPTRKVHSRSHRTNNGSHEKNYKPKVVLLGHGFKLTTSAHYPDIHSVGNFDEGLICEMLHTTLSDIVMSINNDLYCREATGLTLDAQTSSNNVSLSGDFKSASRTENNQNLYEHPKRFTTHPQVLSTMSFSGRQYWEVETSGTNYWMIGMCYPSMERNGPKSFVGANCKSWALKREYNRYSVSHGGKVVFLTKQSSAERIRIYLDYEAGRLSFYELCHPLQHLHTFKTTFTEPLHVVFCVWNQSWLRLRS
ncbi:E3 ubiquitin/ISG15 ligase TRIM25-like [Ranitomeya variabilis]|uniref:E3 ubiquitin/ISG15 ligase TRIM25-like n=1 Tax=Ranitomeya variabilis TaxID=490064 RepID=UPI0040574F74